MTLKSLSIAFATTALVAVASTAFAQEVDKSGTNVDTAATGTKGGVAQIALAQDLYALGLANKDALAVVTAAKLLSEVTVTEDTSRTPKTTGEGEAAEAGEAAPPVDLGVMLASARELAGDDETITALITDIETAGTRGRIGGPSSTLSRLPAGFTDTWEVPFFGNSYAELAVLGDGDANLDVWVTDENGNTICYDVSWSDKVYCDFVPAWNGYFYVTVENNGSRRNSYYLVTN